jgi:multiple sugar transport system substrate-binding protein
MNRKIITTTTPALLAAVAAATALAACGGDDSAASASKTVGGAITYSFWGSPARADKVNQVISDYQKAHSNVKVTGEVADYNSYIERLTVKAAGGGLSCVIGTQSTFIAPYADKKVLLPLDNLIKSKAIDVSQIPADVLKAGQIDGKQYMIPTGTFVRILAYNTDLIKAAGAPAPTNDLTWEGYAAWLKQVQQGLPKGKYAGEIEANNMFSFTSWVVGHGQQMFKGNELGFDKQVLVDWFNYWLDLQKAGATVPPSMLPDQQLSLEQTPLAKGIAASGTRDIPHLYITEKALEANKLGTSVKGVSIPTEDPKASANILGSNGLSIPKSCDNQATAASFINFFTNDKAAALVFQSDNGILTNTANQQALLADTKTPAGVKQNVTIFKDLNTRGDLTTSKYPDGLSTLTSELNRLYQQVAFGQMTSQAAADAFFNKAAQALR